MNIETSGAFLDLAFRHGWVFRLVIAGLVAVSLASWTVIVHKWRELATAQRDLHSSDQLLVALARAGASTSKASLPPVYGFNAALVSGWARAGELLSRCKLDSELVREGARYAWEGGAAKEGRRISRHLTFLATVGSVSPYVGLFGTVWGVIDALVGLGQVDQVSLALVAPGIAEALVATAVGLFAAIPAIVAHNLYVARIERLTDTWMTLIDDAELELAAQLQGAEGVSGPAGMRPIDDRVGENIPVVGAT